jgi:2-polyprenyl-3-methyl-5-hydroxy-6-metoxy-1,4-benzoquinol methylase
MGLLTACPVCKHNVFSEFLKTKDYFLSKEEFTIVQCGNCGFRFVNPSPNEQELGRYYESTEYISHNNEKKDLRNYLYSIIRNFTIQAKFNLVRKNSTGNRILDWGCGTGEFLANCQKNGWNVTGFEPNKSARDFAKQKHQIEVKDKEGLAALGRSEYDVITLWHVLEHIYNLEDAMKTITKILKPSGTIIIAVPNSNSWDALHYQKYWAAYDVPRHLYHFTQKTISKLAESHSLTTERVIPMKLDSFYVSLLSEKYQRGNYNYFRAAINGVRSNFYARHHNKEYSSLIFICKINNG